MSLRHLSLAALGVGASMLCVNAQAQLAPSASADDVVIAVRACATATDAAGIRADALATQGWREATRSPPMMRFFGKPPNRALISVENNGKTCGVSAGLPSDQAFEDVVARLVKDFGPTTARQPTAARWAIAGKTVTIAKMTGAGGGPAVRADVRPRP